MGETMPSPVIATRRMGRLPSSFVPVYGRRPGRSKRLEGGGGLPGAVSNVGCADKAATRGKRTLHHHAEAAFQRKVRFRTFAASGVAQFHIDKKRRIGGKINVAASFPLERGSQ